MTPLPSRVGCLQFGMVLVEVGRDRLDLRIRHAVRNKVEGFRTKGGSDIAQRGQAGFLVLNQLYDKGSRRLDEITADAAKAARWEPMLWNTAKPSISSAIHN